LRAADRIEFVCTAERASEQNRGIDRAVRFRGRHDDDARHARDLRRHDRHDDRRRQRRGAARHVGADRTERTHEQRAERAVVVAMLAVAQQLALVKGGDPLARQPQARCDLGRHEPFSVLGGGDGTAQRSSVAPGKSKRLVSYERARRRRARARRAEWQRRSR
jgi:hypothetical protein